MADSGHMSAVQCFFLSKLLFCNNFRFTKKLKRYYPEFSYSHPVSPIVNILHYHSTFAKTKKPTLVHYYYLNLDWICPIFPLIYSLCLKIQYRVLHCILLSWLSSFLWFLTVFLIFLVLLLLFLTWLWQSWWALARYPAECPLNCVCLMFFPLLCLHYEFLEKIPQWWSALLSASYQGLMIAHDDTREKGSIRLIP